MTQKTKKAVVDQGVELVATRSAADRIVKIADGVFLLRPRNIQSKALPAGPYQGVCRESGDKFVYYACNVKRGAEWVPPVIDLHPETLRERMINREKAIASLPAEVLAAWHA